MNFELSDEQIAIRDTARELLAKRWNRAANRAALMKPPACISAALWAELAGLGWFGIACDEAFGGGAQDLVTAAILVEEAGRALLPGLLTSTLSAAAALNRCADPVIQQAFLPDLIAGRKTWSLAYEEDNGGWGPDTIELAATALGDQDHLTVNGTKILVPSGAQANYFLVALRGADGLCLAPVAADAPGLTITAMQRIDAEDLVQLRFEQLMIRHDGTLGANDPSGRLVRDVYAIGTVLTAASLLGNAEALLQMTADYARQRVQFGRPIGSFQAVSHRLADVLVNVEIGRSLLYGACLSLEERRDDASALVSAAKSWLSEAAIHAAEAALQLHGGIGYTWEMDVHLYLRRVRAEALAFGDADHHRTRIARYLVERLTPTT
jgi:alkylation response protein AidB-like acyl-CoA dehydrogenase